MFFFLQRSKPKTISSHSHKNLDSNEDRKKVGRVVETKILILDSRIDRIVNRSNSLPNSKLTIISRNGADSPEFEFREALKDDSQFAIGKRVGAIDDPIDP